MQTLLELGEAVTAKRHSLGLKQADAATKASVSVESLSRFERGRAVEFGSRKLLAVLAVLGAELDFMTSGLGYAGRIAPRARSGSGTCLPTQRR